MPRFCYYLVLFLALFSACSPIVDTSQQFADGGTTDIQKSIDYLDKIIEHSPRNANALFQRAILELQLSRTIKAKEDIVTAIDIDPLNLDFLLLKAKIDDKLGQYKEALQTIEFILENRLNISTIDAQLLVSDLYLKTNNLSKSEFFLQKASANAPNFVPVIYQRAKFYATGHDTIKAKYFYKQLLFIDSTHEGGILGLADIYLKNQLPDSSLIMLSNITESDNFLFYVLMAKSLMQTSKVDSAAYWWGKALLKSPRLAEAHYELGKHFYKLKNYTSARLHFASVPENERAKYLDYDLFFAKISEKLSDSATSAYYYQKASKLDSSLMQKKSSEMIIESKEPIVKDSIK